MHRLKQLVNTITVIQQIRLSVIIFSLDRNRLRIVDFPEIVQLSLLEPKISEAPMKSQECVCFLLLHNESQSLMMQKYIYYVISHGLEPQEDPGWVFSSESQKAETMVAANATFSFGSLPLPSSLRLLEEFTSLRL